MSKLRTGGCLCGKVRFTLSAEPLITMACHCRGCQKLTASAFSLSVLMAEAAFTVDQGEPVIGALHAEHRHFFCDWCKSWLFTRPAGVGPFVNVRTTMLDDPSGLEPYLESKTAEKLPWATTPAVESFEDFPPREAFPALVAAYAARATSPS
jgi:hypothetical protein